MRPRLSDVTMTLDGGRLTDLKINGQTVHVMELQFRVGIDNMPVLEVEIPIITAEIKGAVAVEVTNAPKGSRLVHDTQGHTWIEPVEPGGDAA